MVDHRVLYKLPRHVIDMGGLPFRRFIVLDVISSGCQSRPLLWSQRVVSEGQGGVTWINRYRHRIC